VAFLVIGLAMPVLPLHVHERLRFRVKAGYPAGTPASEVSRIGRRWLKAHGEHAVTLARDRVSELEGSGNIDGAGMWRRIIAAIEKLRASKAK
jgi:hypothetical protein